MNRFFTLTFITLCIALLPLWVNAQNSIGGSLSISTVHPYPTPFEEVRLSAENIAPELLGSIFIWRVDGVVIERGVGIKETSFIAGDVGQYHNVSLTLTNQAGAVIASTQREFPVSRIVLLADSYSYTPPLYKGAALHPAGSSVWVSAFPEVASRAGARPSKETLVYTWKFNGKVVGNQSGYGQYAFKTALAPRLSTVSVEVSLPGGSVVGEARITLNPRNPELFFYVHNPLLGPVFEHTAGNEVRMQTNEITIGAYPYYASVPNRISRSIRYEWSLNRNRLTQTTPTITLRAGKNTGKATLHLFSEHLTTLFQEMEKTLTIELPNR